MRTTIALLAALAVAGCANKGTLVVVTVDSSSPLATVASLHVSASAGGRTRDYSIPLSSAGIPPARTFGITVPPSIGGTFAVTVDALDDGGTTLASAHGEMPLHKGARVDIGLDLSGGGGSDGGAGDGGAPDMTTPAIALATTTPLVLVRQGGSATVPLTLTRGPGVSGDVTLTASGLPSGVATQPATIAAADSKGALTLVAAAQASQGGPTTVTITGSNGMIMGTLQINVVVAGAAGTLDQSFGTAGAVVIDFPTSRYDVCSNLALTPDTKPVIGGISMDPNNLGPTDLAIAQLLPLGGYDPAFGANGRKQVHVGDNESLEAVAVQPDGKIVLAGRYAAVAGKWDLLVVRLGTDGSLDGAFGTAGVFTTDMGGDNDVGEAIAIQPDGKILIVGGQFTGTAGGFLARLNGDGTLDTGFGSGGKLALTAIGASGYDLLRAAAIRSDGKIIAAGVSGVGASNTEDALVLRVTAAGALDTTFGTNGSTLTNGPYSGNDAINAIALNADDSIIAAGHAQVPYMSANQTDFAVFRYTADGALDTAFGSYGGIAMIDWAHLNDDAYGVAIQPADGKIVVSGNARQAMGQDNGVARLDATGMFDPAFGSGGKVDVDLKTNDFDGAFQLALQPDGRIVVGGYINDAVSNNNNYDCTVIRLWP